MHCLGFGEGMQLSCTADDFLSSLNEMLVGLWSKSEGCIPSSVLKPASFSYPGYGETQIGSKPKSLQSSKCRFESASTNS